MKDGLKSIGYRIPRRGADTAGTVIAFVGGPLRGLPVLHVLYPTRHLVGRFDAAHRLGRQFDMRNIGLWRMPHYARPKGPLTTMGAGAGAFCLAALASRNAEPRRGPYTDVQAVARLTHASTTPGRSMDG